MQEPTPEMIAFYERRTQAHIERVRSCLNLLAAESECGAELLERAQVHDASKYGPEERVPYIWLTEFHRRAWKNGYSLRSGIMLPAIAIILSFTTIPMR